MLVLHSATGAITPTTALHPILKFQKLTALHITCEGPGSGAVLRDIANRLGRKLRRLTVCAAAVSAEMEGGLQQLRALKALTCMDVVTK